MKIRLLTIALAFSLSASAAAEDVVVTRHFSGHWNQPEQESQGLILQVVNQDDGSKNAVAYWFTNADDRESSWLLGVGPVEANHIQLDLFRASDVGFMEDDHPGNANVAQVGSMEIEFSSCDDGTVTFSTTDSAIGSGDFPISRITSIFNTECSGGISDDTPSDVLPSDQRISLVPARQEITASGHADFKEQPDRTEFSVESQDLADGRYRISVGGVDRGELVVSGGHGETGFRSPAEPGKTLLTFDPRGRAIEVSSKQGAVLTSGDAGLSGDDTTTDDPSGDDTTTDDNNDGGGIDFGTGEIEVDLTNAGVFPEASGDAKFEARDDRTEFSVEIEDVPAGIYDLKVGGTSVGDIHAAMDKDGKVHGEAEFRVPVEPGKTLLDFDPRGQTIEVLDGTDVILDAAFPLS